MDVYQADRLFGAVTSPLLPRPLVESEWNIGRFQMTRPGLRNKPEIPVQGFHTTLAYFVTGEEIEPDDRRAPAAVPPV